MNKNNADKISLEKEAKKLYFKNWRSNNKDKVAKINQRFWRLIIS